MLDQPGCVHAWGMHGACMEHAWSMYGACMGHVVVYECMTSVRPPIQADTSNMACRLG